MAHTADKTIQQVHEFESMVMNAPGVGEVILGPSTSVLVESVANAYANSGLLKGHDEVILW